MTYEARLRRVVRYIHENVDGDLSLDTLADIAALSRFHFHRVYRTMTGETCADTVRRARTYRASHLLVQTTLSLDEIASSVGYDNTQSFNRAFRTVFSQTPTVFRKSGTPRDLNLTLKLGDPKMTDVTTREMPGIRLASLPHRGPYNTIAQAFENLSATFNARNLWPEVRGMAAIYYDDIGAVPDEDLHSAAAFVVDEAFEMPEGVEEEFISAGRIGVLLHKGPYAGLPQSWDDLYRIWLPDSGETTADAPPFELYLNDPRDTAPEDLRTEICVPLA